MMKPGMIRRHSAKAIFLHWFNTVCWFFLLGTGVGLIDNPSLQPLGMWWPRLMHTVFGSPEMLLSVHEVCGFLWAGVIVVYGLVFLRTETLPFLREVFSFSVRDDMRWLLNKSLVMTLPTRFLEKMGVDPTLPDQHFYNVGQKLFAIPAVVGGALIAASGFIMAFSRAMNDPGLTQWSILIHFATVGFVTAGLLVHVFMAAIATGEGPALRSMFTGFVPEEFARHHNRGWYDALIREQLKNRR